MAQTQKSQIHLTYRILDLGGGVNTKAAATQLLPNEVREMLNWRVEARGGIKKRGGYTPYVTGDTTDGNPITGLMKYKSQTVETVVRVRNAVISESSGGGDAWTGITGTETISANANDRVAWSQFVQNVVFTDGVNIPLKWAGTGNVAKIAQAIGGGADTIDKAYTLVRHQERIVLGDVTATIGAVQSRRESGIWPSGVGTLDTWEATTHPGVIRIEEGDGDSITNLQSLLGYLVVFKQNSLHRVSNYGVAGQQVVRKVASIGTPGKHTAAVVGPFVFFLDKEGKLWVYDVRGDNEDSVVEVSDPKLGVDTLDSFLRSRLQYGHLSYRSDTEEVHAFLTETGNTETNTAWVYNFGAGEAVGQTQLLDGAFYQYKWAKNFNVSLPTADSSFAPLFLVGTHDGLVVKFDTSLTDNGTTITCRLLTGQLNLDHLDVVKGLRGLDVYSRITEDQTIQVTPMLDFDESGSVLPILLQGAGDTLT